MEAENIRNKLIEILEHDFELPKEELQKESKEFLEKLNNYLTLVLKHDDTPEEKEVHERGEKVDTLLFRILKDLDNYENLGKWIARDFFLTGLEKGYISINEERMKKK